MFNTARKINSPFALSYQNSWLLWFCQLMNISSLALEISTWMLAILALCLCWQALLINLKFNSNKLAKVSPVLLTLFAIGGCIAIAITAANLGVLISMVHLLTFAYVLKAFEIKRRKDFYQLLLLGLFLLAAALIFKQNLIFSFMLILVLVLNLMVLMLIFSPSKSLPSMAKTISILLIQSTVLAVVLFIVFPRLSPFWQVPSAKSAQTGLSDEVSPGDIANLALSNDLAFRVDFKGGQIPNYSKLYWRAMTLELYDGRKWTRANNIYRKAKETKPFKPETSGQAINYDIIVEPSFQSWLYGLAIAQSTDIQIKNSSDYTIQTRNIISQISHYEINSYLNTSLDLSIDDITKKRNLSIVQGSNPKLERLGRELKSKYVSPQERSNAILAMFRAEQYFYTLKPPLLTNNSLDQFFFNTQAGFCVHYASSYTYLMRAAGIPARVVTGYLGGEYNNTSNEPLSNTVKQQGGHLSVYQYDAHAWSEIWLEGIGWFRVDPTAAVDPERVESGWSSALLEQQSSLNNDFVDLYQLRNIAWLNALRLQLDALDYQWTRWVLGYSTKKQFDLLKRWFGKDIPWKVSAVVVGSLIIFMLLLNSLSRFSLWWFKAKQATPWLVLYNKLRLKLVNKGLKPTSNITPSSFALLVTEQLPFLSSDFAEFTRVFECLMYQDLSKKQQDELLLHLKNQYVKLKGKL